MASEPVEGGFMQLSSMAARVAACAAVALACASCGGSNNKTHVTVLRSAEPTCAANVPGAEISLTDAPEGVTVLYESRSWDNVDVMRAEAHQQVQTQLQARASGGAPQNTESLPAVQTRVLSHPRGMTVTYTAVDPKDTERLRAVIWSDVQRQRRGECSRMRLPAAPTGQAAAPAGKGWKLSLTGVDLDPALAETCQIPSSQTFVVFDSADPHKGDAVALETMAACIARGRYAGGPLRILSYAPETDDEFARIFGRTRAEAVAHWLESLGVDSTQLRVTRSEDHSPSDSDDRGWQWSRRVSITPAH